MNKKLKTVGQTPIILFLLLMFLATLTLYKKDDSITIKEDCTTEQDDVQVTPPLSIESLDRQCLTSVDIERIKLDEAIEVANIRYSQKQLMEEYVEDMKPKVYKANSNGSSTYVLTAYCPCAYCCGTANKPTASGVMPTANHTLSADTSIFPLGTKLSINGMIYTVEDTGSAIHGNKFDVYFNTHQEALNFGRQTTTDVYVVQ